MQHLLSPADRPVFPSGAAGPLGETALRAALHVAGRLKDPERAAQAAAIATTQSRFPEFGRWSAPSLAQGNAGLGLLWAYLDACFPGEGWDVIGKTHLQLAVRAAEMEQVPGPALFSGLSGLAFAGWQLSRDGARYQRLLASLDEAIAHDALLIASRVRASRGCSPGDFDVISGLSGIGAYLLCRRDQPAASFALAHTVDALIALATRDALLPAWYTPPELLYDDAARQSYPNGNLNCGLAHGAPGILAFLALVREAGLGFDRLDEAIVTTADWLCAHHLVDTWGVTWPTAVHLEEDRTIEGGARMRAGDLATVPFGPSRTAWCYGSPGVARSLWLAGRALDRSDYRDLAIAAMEAVFRRPVATRSIDSPSFCHGVAGLLAITLRFARETGLPVFIRESQTLVEQLLGSFQPESLLGFRTIEYESNQTDQPGLLDGAAGVAIVLLAA
ncbi:MAG: lanthionine synthetase C family protein, partial [Longimicrobiales bacterium]